MAKLSPSWPPARGLTTPHVPRDETLLTISGSTCINAPAAVVFETVLDVANYGVWNSFCPSVRIYSQPADVPPDSSKLHVGTQFTFSCVMDSRKPMKFNDAQLRVVDISTPFGVSSYIASDVLENEPTYTSDLGNIYRISWISDDHDHPSLISRGLRAERFHEIIVLGESECEVRTWENQGGVLAYAVRALYRRTLQEKFQLWCDDLKRRSEQSTTDREGNEKREGK